MGLRIGYSGSSHWKTKTDQCGCSCDCNLSPNPSPNPSPPTSKTRKKVKTVLPNPDSLKWTLIRLEQLANAHVMKVRYDGCTNYEGHKIMVYLGKYKHKDDLDPHFCESADSPVARFRPDEKGWANAVKFAESL